MYTVQDCTRQYEVDNTVTRMAAMDYRAHLFVFWSLFWSIVATNLIDSSSKISSRKAKFISGIVPIVWLSQVMAISFMEAWVKFGAPLLTKPVALDVGRRIFQTFNSMELAHAFAFAFFVSLSDRDRRFESKAVFITAILFFVLFFQILWLTPKLNLLAIFAIAEAEKDQIPQAVLLEQEKLTRNVKNKEKPRKILHVVYIFLELVKVFLLFSAACMLLS